MGEKTPDTDDSRIERRDMLKGLGFGAMALAGVGAMGGGAVAQPIPNNAGLTPPDEDLEDDRFTGDPPQIPSDANTVDFVVYSNIGPDRPMGSQLTIFTKSDTPQVVTQAFEEGTSACSGGMTGSDPSGNVEMRHNFSVENLSSGQYVAVLALMDYQAASLNSLDQLVEEGHAERLGPSDAQTGAYEISANVPEPIVDNIVSLIAQEFEVPS